MTRFVAAMTALAAILWLSACAIPPTADRGDIDALAQAIRALGPDVDPAEADRAAAIAHLYPLELAKEYGITDPPLIHNAKVIRGERKRGLCNHWAEDLERRLEAERFRTLDILRAISPPSPFRIIHHTVVISARGGTIPEGIVLDPWRKGGTLFWAPVQEDDHYNWRPRHEVVQELLVARGLPATP
jgi:hypothetical protein